MIFKHNPYGPMLALFLVLICQPVDAAQSETVLKVGISPFSPFVILSPNGPTGMSIDLWQALAFHLETQFAYVECKGVGDKLERLKEGSIDIAIIILIFLPLFGFFVAQLSSDLTMQGLKSNIDGPQDLWGRRVSVVQETTSFDYMKDKHVYMNVFDRVQEAIDALLNGQVEAVVYDAPNLLYFANGAGKGKAMVVGRIFEPQDYGLALPQGSPLREKFNLAILNLIESGELARIKLNWLGDQSGS